MKQGEDRESATGGLMETQEDLQDIGGQQRTSSRVNHGPLGNFRRIMM